MSKVSTAKRTASLIAKGLIHEVRAFVKATAKYLFQAMGVVILVGGIIASSIAYTELTAPRLQTIASTTTHQVSGGNYTYPGFFSLALQDLKQGQPYEVKVSTSGGSIGANFCVLNDGAYDTWVNSYYFTKGPGLTFPQSQCIAWSPQTLQTTLSFTPPSSGTWDIVTINNNPDILTVTYAPAF